MTNHFTSVVNYHQFDLARCSGVVDVEGGKYIIIEDSQLFACVDSVTHNEG